jgi:hypothetical protein
MNSTYSVRDNAHVRSIDNGPELFGFMKRTRCDASDDGQKMLCTLLSIDEVAWLKEVMMNDREFSPFLACMMTLMI